MFSWQMMTTAIVGYFAIIFKEIPIRIVNMISDKYRMSVSIKSNQNKYYLALNNWLDTLEKSQLKYNQEIEQEFVNTVRNNNIDWVTKDRSILAYGFYLLYMGKFTWITVSKKKNNNGNGSNGDSSIKTEDIIKISFTGFQRKKYFKECKDFISSFEYAEEFLDKYLCVDQPDKQTKYLPKRNIETVFSPEKNKIINHINNWKSLRNIYIEHGITYKTGILLYGKPGTGKTSMVKAIASYYSMELIIINLSEVSVNPRLITDGFDRAYSNSIVLLEDIDCVIGDRKDNQSTVTESNMMGVTKGSLMQTLLNSLDGISSSECIVFATTNYIDRLDSALIRPGRFDLLLEMEYFNKEVAEEYISSYNIDPKEIIDKIELPVCPAQLQQLCLSKLNNIDLGIYNKLNTNKGEYSND